MIIGIDGSNIRAGGGITHLKNLLENVVPINHGIKKIYLWGNAKLLSSIEERDFLIKINHKYLDGGLLKRIIWKVYILHVALRKEDVSLLFSPDGTYFGHFKPFVSISQNMLIFEKKESKRFGLSLIRVRYFILNFIQQKSFRKAKGLIFISKYAKNYIQTQHSIFTPHKIIYHGISKEFINQPKFQYAIDYYSNKNPIKILYVSIINFYKHQWNVVEAVAKLKEQGIPVELSLVGPAYKPALKKFNKSLNKVKSSANYIKYLGPVEYSKIKDFYKDADIFIFASTCENMPNILVEAMSAGLPILCSNYGPMPEILKDGGVYFDPLIQTELVDKLAMLIHDPELRTKIAQKAYIIGKQFSWEKTAKETFDYFESIVNDLNNK
ncbi:MAG: glycosyltransferase family 4 protein [Arcobacter sp.]|nr:glycosyltransferase family 4 protein [Arcobacter sp.]